MQVPGGAKPLQRSYRTDWGMEESNAKLYTFLGTNPFDTDIILERLTNSQFAVNMGTGIVSILLHRFSEMYPSNHSLLHTLSIVFFVCNIFLLFIDRKKPRRLGIHSFPEPPGIARSFRRTGGKICDVVDLDMEGRALYWRKALRCTWCVASHRVCILWR